MLLLHTSSWTFMQRKTSTLPRFWPPLTCIYLCEKRLTLRKVHGGNYNVRYAPTRLFPSLPSPLTNFDPATFSKQILIAISLVSFRRDARLSFAARVEEGCSRNGCASHRKSLGRSVNRDTDDISRGRVQLQRPINVIFTKVGIPSSYLTHYIFLGHSMVSYECCPYKDISSTFEAGDDGKLWQC